MRWPGRLRRALVAVAAVQVAFAAAGAAYRYPSSGAALSPFLLLLALHVAVFAAVGALLLSAAEHDARAATLGAALLLVAAVFARSVAGAGHHTLATATSPVALLAAAVFALRADAFTPWLVWRFARAFPRAPARPRERRASLQVERASLVLGVVLLAANLLREVAPWLGVPVAAARALAPLASSSGTGLYYGTQFVLMLGALGALVARTGRAPADERRRARLLSWGLAAGFAPTLLWTLLWATVPGFERAVPLRAAGWVVYPALLSVPLSTAYAVLVRRALDVRLLVRRAVQYALARWTVMAAAALPVALALLSLQRDGADGTRRHTVAIAALLVAVAVALLRWRVQVLHRIDRHFFREQYDAGRILTELVARCRGVRDAGELASVVRTEVDRALHVENVRLLLLDAEGRLASPAHDVRPLAAGSALAALLAEADAPLDVDPADPRSIARMLVPADAQWVADAGFHLLVPLHRRGVLALGEKRSELPFTTEDESLLSAVAASAELALGHAMGGAPAAAARAPVASDRRSGSWPEQPATECAACRLVQPPATVTCARCGGTDLAPCPLPEVVAGRFAVLQRVGSGGMGVVYEATDLQLDRTVAIKTLPVVSAEEAARLRREARVMAAITHPNLAFVLGAEVWLGRPLLVMEHLAGGTLARRLQRDGPLPAAAVIALGVALADVLAALHRAGVLHRDVKPSNIGFTADGTPKLMDFGLAWLASAAGAEPDEADDEVRGEATATDERSRLARATWRRSLMNDHAAPGTPLYMSPEALQGAEPDASFDLWSLAVVLREALTGMRPRPWERPSPRTAAGTAAAAATVALPVVRQGDASLATLLDRALSLDPRARPRSAAELHDALVALRVPASPPSSAGGAAHGRAPGRPVAR